MRAATTEARAREHVLTEPFSSLLWGVDWTATLPLELAPGVTLEEACLDDVLDFMARHSACIFGDGEASPFLPDPLTAAKRRFLDRSDRFVFRDGRRVVGILLGNPADWSTQYWRVGALLPEYQGHGLIRQAMAHVDDVLTRCGVARAESEVAPTNDRSLRLFLKLGYVVTASAATDRWGVLLKLTKYLAPEAAEVFERQFTRAFRPTPSDSRLFDGRCGSSDRYSPPQPRIRQ